jgi:hypothetical protein
VAGLPENDRAELCLGDLEGLRLAGAMISPRGLKGQS